ncbi:efflux RND transporter periplasmic adaptor subunit [Chryseobacterium sp. 09-1422]|uniref:Efflux RND transporter periplasmic adaptor subunit n=1 Tax=Chryseobacterium kimseyorum TaxID=2984028 RepID=A0ABT3I3R9_9FLAO|nr:efflux RND transporter periplasmic adaptor subunit [Chryseobacterium kimseyorum]MCW3170673.1 efflux RND transporter periplasmic adaptor subunit [Chryseobacterium kimseyorum]
MILWNCSDLKEQPNKDNPSFPVFSTRASESIIYQEFPTSLEGKENVQIRSQVDGYIEKIFVEEGAFVKVGQPLFRIESGIYNEDLNNSSAALSVAIANMRKAQIEVERLRPLVATKVIAPIQLMTAKEEYEAAKATVRQATAAKKTSSIRMGFTIIKSPVDGYIGRLPFKKGSFVSSSDPQPLTTVSNVKVIYAYFSVGEQDFEAFKNKFPGTTIEEKIKNMPEVELITARNSVYPEKGRIDLILGQFDKTVGTISFRASFPNTGGLLRTGNTGRIRLAEKLTNILKIPKESTFDQQDRSFVFIVRENNTVTSKRLRIVGQSTHYYYVKDGIQPAEKIVYSGMGLLSEGAKITPKPFSVDSLILTRHE